MVNTGAHRQNSGPVKAHVGNAKCRRQQQNLGSAFEQIMSTSARMAFFPLCPNVEGFRTHALSATNAPAIDSSAVHVATNNAA